MFGCRFLFINILTIKAITFFRKFIFLNNYIDLCKLQLFLNASLISIVLPKKEALECQHELSEKEDSQQHLCSAAHSNASLNSIQCSSISKKVQFRKVMLLENVCNIPCTIFLFPVYCTLVLFRSKGPFTSMGRSFHAKLRLLKSTFRLCCCTLTCKSWT